MDAILVATIFGLGLLLVFDWLVRPRATADLTGRLRQIAPRFAGAGVGAGVGFLATHWPVGALAAGVVGWTLPEALRRTREERARLERREAVAEISSRLRDSIRSGIGIGDSLAVAAEHAPAAIAADLCRLVSDSRVSGLAEAAEAFAERVRDPSAELLASALSTAERLGSQNLSETLDALAEATAAQAAAVREARTRQTRNRMSARIVAAVPLLLLLAIRRANPAYLAPFEEPAGQAVLAFALSLIGIGFVAMRRAARIEETAR